MRYRDLLLERVLNLHTTDQKAQYAKPVWDMLLRSYKKLGGFKTATTPEQLINEPGYWKLIRRGDRITAVGIYKKVPNTNNFKVVASAAETELDPNTGEYKSTPQGLKDYTMIKDEDIRMKRSWAEVSGPAERLMIKFGAKYISNKYAELLTGKKILDYSDDGYHYTRLIQGEPVQKAIVGFANLSPSGMEELTKLGFSVSELPDNIQANI